MQASFTYKVRIKNNGKKKNTKYIKEGENFNKQGKLVLIIRHIKVLRGLKTY